MPRYTADSLERVREAADIVALVSAHTELKPAGRERYVGRCPFHDERTPSFGIDLQKKVYYCFGCQAAGDPFTFAMETEGLGFVEALETLADRFGVALETEAENPEAAGRRRRRQRLHEVLGRAAEYYARCLWEAPEAHGARSYLLGRGLTEDTLRQFRVGYSPSGWDRVLTASRRAGFSEDELLAVGLVSRSRSRDGQLYDRFRERIMFPSADARGRVLGFGARAMGDDQQPKYLNTSDGELYHKRSQLFGIHLARAAAARAGRMILVEGYTDVLALHQAGLRNAVGIMGTALTEEQITELERVVRVLELCLDADRAGQDAMLRAAKIARGRKLELRVVALPDGTDPADMIERDGAQALRRRVEASVPFVAFHVERTLARADTGSAEGRDRAASELAPVLAELPASVLREDLVRRVAGRLELSEGGLSALLVDAKPGHNRRSTAAALESRAHTGGHRNGSSSHASPATSAPSSEERVVRGVTHLETGERAAEREFLAMCIALPSAGEAILARIDLDELLRTDAFRRAARHLTGRCGAPLAGLPPEDEALARTVADLVARAGYASQVRVEHLEHAHLLLERIRLERAIRRARAERQPGTAALAREREQVREAIHRVVSRLEMAV